MGAFDEIAPIAIPDMSKPDEAEKFRAEWDWEAHETVWIKGAYRGLEQEQVDNASTVFTRAGKTSKVDVRMGTARNKLLEVMIVDWTLSASGQKVPVTRETIARLPANYRTPILRKIDEIARTMNQEEQDDFLPAANGHSEVNSNPASPSLRLL